MRKIIATSIITAALASGSAFAAGAQTGVVIGGSVGYTVPTGYLKDIGGSGADNTNGNIAGGLQIGYDFALNKMLSVGAELGGQYAYELSKVESGGATGKYSNLSIPLFLTGKFYMPWVNGLNVFGKAGYAYNRLNASVDTGISGLTVSENTNLWRPVVAGGVGYQIQQFNIFAQYQYNWLKYQGTNGGYNTLSLGLTYTIPA